jgi:Cu(I)/Ag(I) efflux system membrane protein CusA/SilA
VTSLATTVVSFLPVFAMQASEGKLFHPLALTKTFALMASFLLGIIVLPTFVYLFFNIKTDREKIRKVWNWSLIITSVSVVAIWQTWYALALVAAGINNLTAHRWEQARKNYPALINIGIIVLFAVYFLAGEWLPLGAHISNFGNFLFVAFLIAMILTALLSMVRYYERIMRWALENKVKFLMLPVITLLFGMIVWQGTDRLFGFIAGGIEKAGWKSFRNSAVWQGAINVFPGTGKEFMPSLDEGSFLLMPTSMPHTGIEQNLDYIETLDRRLTAIPEVEVAVGKWGRVNSALDPAPVQMFENTINYLPEYILDENGHRQKYKVNKNNDYILDSERIKDKLKMKYFT